MSLFPDVPHLRFGLGSVLLGSTRNSKTRQRWGTGGFPDSLAYVSRMSLTACPDFLTYVFPHLRVGLGRTLLGNTPLGSTRIFKNQNLLQSPTNVKHVKDQVNGSFGRFGLVRHFVHVHSKFFQAFCHGIGHRFLKSATDLFGQEAFDFSVHGHPIDRFGKTVSFVVGQ